MIADFYIATPCYSDPCHDYMKSLLLTQKSLSLAGYSLDWLTLEGCCYVHTARNKLVRNFLENGAKYLIFIDSDIGWDADEFVRFVAHKQDIVGAAAPFRGMGYKGFPTHWKSQDGVPVGIECETGRLLGSDMIPTAMIKIRREVFLNEAVVKQSPLVIEYDRETLKESMRYRSYFDFERDDAKNVEYGEDVTFCRKCIRAGYQLWLEPNMTIRHWGKDCRSGNLDVYLREPGDKWAA